MGASQVDDEWVDLETLQETCGDPTYHGNHLRNLSVGIVLDDVDVDVSQSKSCSPVDQVCNPIGEHLRWVDAN